MVKELGILDVSVKYQKGKLDIKIIGCRNLKKMDVLSKTDAYVKLFVLPGKHSNLKTKTIKNNQNPTFNSTFSFSLSRDAAITKTAVFQVFDDDVITKDDPIGEARLALREFTFEEGIEKRYEFNLIQFKESPPKVEAYRPPPVPAPIIQERREVYRNEYYSQEQIINNRPSHVDPGLKEEMRLLNERLDSIISSNRQFFNINDDILINLISEVISVADLKESADIKGSINHAFEQQSNDIVLLAQLEAENDALEVENEFLRDRIKCEQERLDYVRNEENKLNEMIQREEIVLREMESKSRAHEDYYIIAQSKMDELLREIVKFKEKKEQYYYQTHWNTVEDWKMDIFMRETKKSVQGHMERSIQRPTITWQIVQKYVERIGDLVNPQFDLNPFLALLERIGLSYSDLVTCEKEEERFRMIYGHLVAREKELCEIRQKRVNTRFLRDEAKFNFLGEFAAKEQALAWLRSEFDVMTREIIAAPGGLDGYEVTKFCETVHREQGIAYTEAQKYVTASPHNSVTLHPVLGHDGQVSDVTIVTGASSTTHY